MTFNSDFMALSTFFVKFGSDSPAKPNPLKTLRFFLIVSFAPLDPKQRR